MASNQDDRDDSEGEESSRRLERFQAKCAAMRARTATELARLAKKRSDTRLRVGVTLEQMNRESENASVHGMVADLFDNEALWDADDTDELILKLFRDLEASGAKLTTAKDLGQNSLLHMAALWNRRVIMDEMVRRGADLNAKNKNGHTPLDLATHWGHFELALQLQHYGGKHTCESERDVAISQRDLARQHNKECEAEMQDALQRLKRAKQEREEFRIERDRLAKLHSEVTRSCNLQADQLKLMEATVSELTAEKHALRIKVAQLADELSCEQAARNNAVQSWKIAEEVITEMQRLQEGWREREEEALSLRNEALEERDALREMARQAQFDQGIAKQHQTDAERERDRALKKLLDAESDIARDKAIWDTKIARVELERRNIQIEIDRQAELLRCENSKLEKQISTLVSTNSRQRQEIEDMSATSVSLQKQLTVQQRELASAAENASKLEDQVRVLQDERREEYRAWRQRIEQSLQQAIAAELRAMLEASVSTWRKLNECQELVFAFDMASLSALFEPFNSESSDEPPLHFAHDPRIQSRLREAEESLQLLQLQSEPASLSGVAGHVAVLCLSITSYLDALTKYTLKHLEHFRKQAFAQEKMIERKDELIQRFTQHRQEKLKKASNPARFRECSVRPSV